MKQTNNKTIIKSNSLEDIKRTKEYITESWYRITKFETTYQLELIDLGFICSGLELIQLNNKKV